MSPETAKFLFELSSARLAIKKMYPVPLAHVFCHSTEAARAGGEGKVRRKEEGGNYFRSVGKLNEMPRSGEIAESGNALLLILPLNSRRGFRDDGRKSVPCRTWETTLVRR